MTKKDSKNFKNSAKCWICGNTHADGDTKIKRSLSYH